MGSGRSKNYEPLQDTRQDAQNQLFDDIYYERGLRFQELEVLVELMKYAKKIFESDGKELDGKTLTDMKDRKEKCLKQVKQRTSERHKHPNSTMTLETVLEDPELQAFFEKVKEAVNIFDSVLDLARENTSPKEASKVAFKCLCEVWMMPELMQTAHLEFILMWSPTLGKEFLEALMLRIPQEHYQDRDSQQKNSWRKEVFTEPLSLPSKDASGDYDHDAFFGIVAQALPPDSVAKRKINWKGSQHEEIELHLSPTHFFDFYDEKEENWEFLRCAMLLAFAGARDSADNNCITTPFGQAIVHMSWELSFPQFVWQRSADLLFIFFLSYFIVPVTHAAHSDNPQWPADWKILVCGAFGCRGILNIILELFLVAFQDRQRRNLYIRAYATTFTVLSVLVELISVYYTYRIVKDYWKEPHPEDLEAKVKTTFLYKNPMQFAGLIFMKWLQLMLTMSSLEVVTQTFLPAWHAIKSQESVIFLTYLGLLTVGCMLAYYALPVADIENGTSTGYLMALTRMAKLTMMGDFDMWGLEGINDRIDEKSHEIDHANPSPEMHEALRLWSLMLALVFPVILLNVYVGLLGSAYDKAYQKSVAIAGHFRISASVRLLLHRRFWKNILCGLCSLDMFQKIGIWRRRRTGQPTPFALTRISKKRAIELKRAIEAQASGFEE